MHLAELHCARACLINRAWRPWRQLVEQRRQLARKADAFAEYEFVHPNLFFFATLIMALVASSLFMAFVSISSEHLLLFCSRFKLQVRTISVWCEWVLHRKLRRAWGEDAQQLLAERTHRSNAMRAHFSAWAQVRESFHSIRLGDEISWFNPLFGLVKSVCARSA